MKGRDGKTNIDLNEPPGAFVGAEAGMSVGGEPPRKSRGPQRVKGDNFMATGESQATSIKAARMPTHWRRGGFVRRADGGFVPGRDRGSASPPGDLKEGPPPEPDRDEETNYKRGGMTGHKSGGPVQHQEGDWSGARFRGDPLANADEARNKTAVAGSRRPTSFEKSADEEADDPRGARGFPSRYKSGGHLSAAARKALPSTSFALPGQGKGPQGKGAGSYPINDASHARNALARVSQHGNPSQQSKVRAAVHRKFPGIGKK